MRKLGVDVISAKDKERRRPDKNKTNKNRTDKNRSANFGSKRREFNKKGR